MQERDDDHEILDQLAKKIDKLSPITKVKYYDNKVKAFFLTETAARTEWNLKEQQRIRVEPSGQRLTNALYVSLRELRTYQTKDIMKSSEMFGVFCNSLQKERTKKEGLKRLCQ